MTISGLLARRSATSRSRRLARAASPRRDVAYGNVQVAIADEAGSVLPRAEAGEIIAGRPGHAGYWQDGEATAKTCAIGLVCSHGDVVQASMNSAISR